MHAEAMEEGPKNPYGNGFIGVETPLTRESKAARVADGSKGTYWKINNPASLHASTGDLQHSTAIACISQLVFSGQLPSTKFSAMIDALSHNLHLCCHQV